MIEKENKLQFMYGMLVEAAENNTDFDLNDQELPGVVEFFE